MRYKTLKGLQDILPPDIAIWQHIESTAGNIFRNYGYQEIRLPIIESTDIENFVIEIFRNEDGSFEVKSDLFAAMGGYEVLSQAKASDIMELFSLINFPVSTPLSCIVSSVS